MKLRSQLGHLQTAEEKSEFLHKALELDARAKVEDFQSLQTFGVGRRIEG